MSDLQRHIDQLRAETTRLYPEPAKIFPGAVGIKHYMDQVTALLDEIEKETRNGS